MKNAKISNAVIKRLPRYRRYLIELRKKGVEKISSKEFSNLIGYTASQIRQDLNNFGGFGQQGYGYSVDGLYDEISAILGLDTEWLSWVPEIWDRPSPSIRTFINKVLRSAVYLKSARI